MVVGEFAEECDIVVIGGGPAGYSAAFRAADLGQRVIIVDDRDTLGGVCLHEGCVPSKTLLHLADTIDRATRTAPMGVTFASPAIDEATVDDWIAKTVNRLSRGLAGECSRRHITHVQGRATFEDPRHLAIQGGDVRRITFRKAIIATGSTPVAHPSASFDHPRVLSTRHALRIATLPARIAVIGDDYDALESATIAHAMGRTVHLVTPGERALPTADADLVRPVERRLKSVLAGVHVNAGAHELDVTDTGVAIRIGNDTIEVDAVVIALGFHAGVDGLNAPVEVDEAGAIIVDEQMKTSNPRIFAVGDCTGGPMLANRAIRQGRVAGECATGALSGFDARCCPYAVFTVPNIAWCGLTEQQANAAGVDVDVLRIPWGMSGRATGMDEATGVTKLITAKDSRLVLGVGLAGAGAAEMIGEAALAIEMGATITDLAQTMHPHPSIIELISEGADQVAVRTIARPANSMA